jgi:hypothetical protein
MMMTIIIKKLSLSYAKEQTPPGLGASRQPWQKKLRPGTQYPHVT